MATIFKRTAVKNKIDSTEFDNFEEKLEILKSWYEAYQSGSLQKKTESQCEQAFNNDIFKKILGYSEYPSQPHTIIPKLSPEKGGQTADAVLGWFNEEKKNVVAVVEIKDANTPLERSQRREGSLTPIQQAFKYKPLFKNCRFVIATNFFEIRLFQDTQLDYEKFTLKGLVDPKNDYFELKKFLLILSAENFVSNTGKSKTERLLSEIRIEQEKITDKFYSEYSNIRLKLMRNIWKNNEDDRDINFVINKSQKILDRIVFVCFCEDTGLLPDNILYKVFKSVESENNFLSRWDLLVGFFNAIDRGSDKLGIPTGYNGGLFKKDDDLDNLIIDEEILIELSEIAKYDFEQELSVNVLGHVFEQSISDIEEIKKKVHPDEIDHKSKRKKDGIYYTPEYIVDYIVQNSLGRYLRENEERIFNKHNLNLARTDSTYQKREIEALREYQDFLQTVKVVDPACGSGAFLVKVFDYLFEENRRVGELIGGLFDQDQIYKDILKNNIFGVDLNEESVRITQLSLWLKTAQRGKKLTFLDKNIKIGNSLIESVEVASDKAFSWFENFPEIFKQGGFDVVVGNPPYVATKEISKEQRDYFWEKYSELLVNEMDLYELFIFDGVSKLLKEGSYLGYITPNSFYTTDSFKHLRSYLLENVSIINIVDFPYRFYPFKDVNKETCIQIYKKEKNISNTLTIEIADKVKDPISIEKTSSRTISQKEIITIYGGKVTTKPSKKLRAILSQDHLLGEYIKLHKGWMSVPKSTKLSSGETIDTGVFSYNEVEENKLQSICEKYLEGKDIHRYYYDNSSKFVNTTEIDEKTATWHKEEKIILQRIVGQNKRKIFATLDDKSHIIFPNANIINRKLDINLKVVLGILNSNVINDFYNDYFGESNTNVTKTAIENIPVPGLTSFDNKNLIHNVSQALDLTSSKQDVLSRFLNILQAEYKILRLTTKLKNFYQLSESEFLSELKKVKANYSAEKRDSLLDFFEERKQKILEIDRNLSTVESNIEKDVRNMYKL